jgi:hypothetical protein
MLDSVEEVPMRTSSSALFLLTICFVVPASPLYAQKQLAHSASIRNAKTVCFDNQTGSDSVGKSALDELKKWGKYKLVADRKDADLIFLLSADPYRGGDLLLASGQTGSIQNGEMHEDSVPNYNKASPTREVYLTVIDSKSGQNLWSDKHVWGGLLTGFNSAGARLVKKLESQTKH